MAFPSEDEVAALKRAWTDKFVRVRPGVRPELARFEQRLGRVVTVNFGGRAIVDFADGGWYDIARFAEVLDVVTDTAEIAKFDSTANSAQRLPARQS
jgi:hypothetical protein